MDMTAFCRFIELDARRQVVGKINCLTICLTFFKGKLLRSAVNLPECVDTGACRTRTTIMKIGDCDCQDDSNKNKGAPALKKISTRTAIFSVIQSSDRMNTAHQFRCGALPSSSGHAEVVAAVDAPGARLAGKFLRLTICPAFPASRLTLKSSFTNRRRLMPRCMIMLKKFLAVLPLVLLTGCATTFTRLTPLEQPRQFQQPLPGRSHPQFLAAIAALGEHPALCARQRRAFPDAPGADDAKSLGRFRAGAAGDKFRQLPFQIRLSLQCDGRATKPNSISSPVYKLTIIDQ